MPFIFLIIALILVVIFFIIIRHFPALAVLDVENMPEEKERLVKEKIIKERIKRKFSFLENFFDKIINFFNKIASGFWLKLGEIKESQIKNKEVHSLSKLTLSEKISLLFSQSEKLIKQEELLEAEKKLIEIIRLDDKNFPAFYSLGEVYSGEEKWQEAKQTLSYALKISEGQDASDIANIHYSLALINKEMNNLEGALKSISESLEINQNNPRYLDLMLDLCIMKKDKYLSSSFLDKIKKINPENNNIEDWESQIRLM